MKFPPCWYPSVACCLIWAWAVAWAPAADWVVSRQSRGEGKPALVRKEVAHPGGGKASLQLAAFSSKDFTLRVVDQGDDPSARRYANLREAMEKNGCVAGVNGGFFGVDFKALGGVHENGKMISPVANSSRKGLTSSVIWSGAGGIHIVRRESFKAGPEVRQAIQTGPMLVSCGATVPGLSREKPRPRSFVLTDWKGSWMIGTSSSVSLAELAEILASPGVMTEFRVDRAINLDGGSSTGFYFKQPDGTVLYDSEFAPVRNFLGIVPKT